MTPAYRCIAAACLLVLQAALQAAPGRAQTLTGSVTSAAEGAMEGVLVTVQKDDSPISTTAVSDASGHFRFPDGRLTSGHYILRIRATGYELDEPRVVDLGAAATNVAIKLAKTSDLAAQLTNTEWFMSMPGTAEQKRPLIECMSCHTFERIARSTYDAESFVPVLERMAQYANNTTQAHVQSRVAAREVNDDSVHKLAAYLATINLSHGPKWTYKLQTLPRPKGRATRAVITEYDMPEKTIAPHDVRVVRDGQDGDYVWFSDFVENFLGRLELHTGAVTEYPIPVSKPGFPTGSLDLEADADGNLWLALMFQTGLARFDMKSKKFTIFPLPSDLNDDAMQQSMVMPAGMNVDGKVWTNDVARQSIMRLDVKTGAYERVDPFAFFGKSRLHAPYGMAADPGNNLYFMDFGGEAVGRVDAKSLEPTLFPTPTGKSRPRRTMLDGEGHLWFTEFAANKLAMFDIKAEAFKEWDVPTPHTYPYDVYRDKNGELWSGGMASDRVLRFDPQSGKSVEYLLPRSTNIRRVFVDDSTNPVTFWVGNNHGAEILRVEPLD
jgi:virginiamycin B lyase